MKPRCRAGSASIVFDRIDCENIHKCYVHRLCMCGLGDSVDKACFVVARFDTFIGTLATGHNDDRVQRIKI